MKKRAISPLIATILLVVVAVVLVGILMSWGQNFVQKSTNDADNTVDTTCTGAAVNIINCDFNSVGDSIKFTMINSGTVVFQADNNFNIILIDSNHDLNNSNNNILSTQEFGLGESEVITIAGYGGIGPIDLELRNTQCTGYFWAAKCK